MSAKKSLHGLKEIRQTQHSRWSPVAVLIWITPRSRRFMDARKGLPLPFIEDTSRVSASMCRCGSMRSSPQAQAMTMFLTANALVWTKVPVIDRTSRCRLATRRCDCRQSGSNRLRSIPANRRIARRPERMLQANGHAVTRDLNSRHAPSG
jgi:hypothetical protein